MEQNNIPKMKSELAEVNITLDQKNLEAINMLKDDGMTKEKAIALGKLKLPDIEKVYGVDPEAIPKGELRASEETPGLPTDTDENKFRTEQNKLTEVNEARIHAEGTYSNNKELGAKELVDKFLNEYNLANKLPNGFEELSDDKKLYVVNNLKKRLVNIVKSEAETQYSEYLKQKIVNSTSNSRFQKIVANIKNAGKSIGESAKKESELKNLESEAFKELISSKEGQELIAQDLVVITKSVKEQRIVYRKEDKEFFILHMIPEDIEGCTPEEREVVYRFNTIANKFREMPYEWGQEGKSILGGNKRKYEKVRSEYEKVRSEILNIKAKRESPDGKAGAVLEVSEIDSTLKMEQLLNTHPEFEKEFENLSNVAGNSEKLKTAGRFINTILGKNWTNRGLIMIGAGIRVGAKGAVLASKMTGMTALIAPIAGGMLGSIRGGIKGVDIIKEKEKQARYGKEDKEVEIQKTQDAENLAERMETMILALENASSEEKRKDYLDQIKRRIEYTKGKIEQGLVNFGDAKSALGNQYNLIDSLNRAMIVSSSLEETTRKDIDQRLNTFLINKKEVVDEAQAKFIKKQMVKGALIGAGFATFGYLARWAGEEMGWWDGVPKGKVAEDLTSTTSIVGTQDIINAENEITPPRLGQAIDNTYVKKPNFEQSGLRDIIANNPVKTTEIIDPTAPEQVPNVSHTSIEATVDKGQGAIRTIEKLQGKLQEEYGGDISKAPASVQHILNTKADKLAMEYEMFKPGQDAESAMFKMGAKFSVDENGNLTYQEGVGKETILLEKGNELKASDTYEGKMFDSDRSGSVRVGNNLETNPIPNSEDIPQSIPEGVNSEDLTQIQNEIAQEIPEGLKTPDESVATFLNENTPETTPEIKTPDESVAEFLKNNTPEKQLEIANTINTVKEDIVPKPPRVYESGGLRNIYPTGQGGNINIPRTGEVTGNGFTTEVPMTKQEEMEFYDNAKSVRTANVTEALDPKDRIHNISTDPRHLESASDVRRVFGRPNIVIDKPDSDYINGIEAKEWTKEFDQWAKENSIRFKSYDDYIAKRELQELFPGKGIQKEVVYNPTLDKQVEKINVDYFKNREEWPIIEKIPAKYFFDFNEARLADGNPIPEEDLEKLIAKGVIEDNINGAGNRDYSFANEDELKRLAKVYAKVDPLNAKPIGDESMEKYISRITRDLHKTNDGTLFMFKKEAAGIERDLDNGTFGRQEAMQQNSLKSNRVSSNNSSYDYRYSRTLNNGMGGVRNYYSGWTTPVW